MFQLFVIVALLFGIVQVGPLDGPVEIPGVEPPGGIDVEPAEPPIEGPVVPGFPPESWGEPCSLIGLQ